MRIISGAVIAIVSVHAAHAIHHNPATIALHHAMMAAVDQSMAVSGVPNGARVVASIWPASHHVHVSTLVVSRPANVHDRAY